MTDYPDADEMDTLELASSDYGRVNAIYEIAQAIDDSGRLSELLSEKSWDRYESHEPNTDLLIQLVEDRHPKIANCFAFRCDIERLADDRSPIYFASALNFARRVWQELSSQIRKRAGDMNLGGISNEHRGGVHVSVVFEEAMRRLKWNIDFADRWGAPPDYLMYNTACPVEQADFYNTEGWRCRAESIKALDSRRCKQCGRGNATESIHAHHDEPIYGLLTTSFVKNFESNRIYSMCKSCHEAFHRERLKHRRDFVPVSSEMLEYRRLVRIAHDNSRVCGYCFGIDSLPTFYQPQTDYLQILSS
ncbi:hypothetical protein [Prosthecobacter sp.]|uniref:hypothetical protein n=1 Tax=Prosthecobacter sp. TaxID=1965333 RepID=UPI002ABA29AB|nr:hypothetical protein [Prosthecobacter sp.]MDZ4406069.1 hypothetical protein [Prosthecobacter sp.]